MQVGCVVVGAGAVGLSVASNIAKKQLIPGGLLVLERHAGFGRETSSRNSEVIHASVYYAKGSLKARLCAQGNEMMYAMCRGHGIAHKNTGKLLVARSEEECRIVPGVFRAAQASGGKGLRIVEKQEIADLEPNVQANLAVYCPTSGVVDSHGLVQHYETQALKGGADVVYNSEVTAIRKLPGRQGYELQVDEVDLTGKEAITKSTSTIRTKCLVNCAGIGSARISTLAGIDPGPAGYVLRPTRGVYFRVNRKLDRYPAMLVYPLPNTSIVGIHTCPDLWGGMRLGPYETWIDIPQGDAAGDPNVPDNRCFVGGSAFDLTVDPGLADFFTDFCRPFLPFLESSDISPENVGIHPKLQGPGEGMRDWEIRHEADRGLPNFFNLVGIESPGLTSSPAIGQYVAELMSCSLQG